MSVYDTIFSDDSGIFSCFHTNFSLFLFLLDANIITNDPPYPTSNYPPNKH